MAYTVVRKQHQAGDMRVVVLSCTADAATQTVETGLKNIFGFSVGPISMATLAVSIYANSSASGVRAMGSLGMSGVNTNDEFYVVCFGC
jgi:hypothetical protein